MYAQFAHRPPPPEINPLELLPVLIEERRPGVVGAEGSPVLCAPAFLVIDPNLGDAFAKGVENGYGHVHPALRALDPVSVLPAILGVCRIIQQHEHVAPRDLIHIAQPGEVVGLMNGNYHISPSLATGWCTLGLMKCCWHQAMVRWSPSSN